MLWTRRRTNTITLVSFLQPSGEDQKIDFSNVPEISAYIPQIRNRNFPWPLLACDIDGVPDTLIGWTDSHNSYDVHNLIYDVPYEGSKRKRSPTVPDKNEGTATVSEHDDEGDDSASKNKNVTSPDGTGTATDIPKWPIFSLVKYYPRSFGK